jgi:pyruvate formate-lyase activating enzyme-like uncharacterized protein
MKVKNNFTWHRGFSAVPDGIEIKAGAPVEWNEKNKCYYVCPSYFKPVVVHGKSFKSIEQDDAEYYGCRVDSKNVEGAPNVS